MVVEEIISHSFDNTRGTIHIEFIITENENLIHKNMEVYIDELEEYCKLFEDIDWVDDDEEYQESITLYNNIDLLQLQEGLTRYIQDNKDFVEI